MRERDHRQKWEAAVVEWKNVTCNLTLEKFRWVQHVTLINITLCNNIRFPPPPPPPPSFTLPFYHLSHSPFSTLSLFPSSRPLTCSSFYPTISLTPSSPLSFNALLAPTWQVMWFSLLLIWRSSAPSWWRNRPASLREGKSFCRSLVAWGHPEPARWPCTNGMKVQRNCISS